MFKDDLCAAMEKEKVTSQDLADYIGVSKRTVTGWRTGEKLPRLKHMNAISELFGLSKDKYRNESVSSYKKRLDFEFNGAKLREKRESYNLSQRQLGEAVGVSESAISTWEKGINQPKVVQFRSLCGYFGVKEEYFKKGEKKNHMENTTKAVPSVFDSSKPTLPETASKLEERVKELEAKIDEYDKKIYDLKQNINYLIRYIDNHREAISEIPKLMAKNESKHSDNDLLVKALCKMILKEEKAS